MPFFSTIIPVYNRSRLIEATLRSVLAQTLTDQEIIVVNDGSTDDTADVLDEWRERGLQIIHQENAGPGAARNTGIRAASGEYVAFIDSDDLWFPWSLEVYRESIAAFGEPATVLGSVRRFHDQIALEAEPRGELRAQSHADYLAAAGGNLWVGTPVTVVRRESLCRIGGFGPERMLYEDEDLWLRLGVEPGFVHIAEPKTLAYREHSGRISTNAEQSLAGCREILHRERRDLYPGGPCRQRERDEIICHLVRASSVGLARRGYVREAAELYARSLLRQLRCGRARYVCGFPLEAARGLLCRPHPRSGAEVA